MFDLVQKRLKKLQGVRKDCKGAYRSDNERKTRSGIAELVQPHRRSQRNVKPVSSQTAQTQNSRKSVPRPGRREKREGEDDNLAYVRTLVV
jgi:hypothetical protein